MAKVILSTGETYTVAAGNTAELIGTAGAENITIQDGANVVLDASFNQGGDTLVLSGNAANYTMQVAGTTVTLTDANGNTIQVPAGAVGADVQFADGTRQLIIDTTAGAVKLGDDTVTATATTPSGSTPSTPDNGGSTTDQTVALTTSQDNIVGGAGDDTILTIVDGNTAANTTLTLGDVINGGAGTDTLNVTSSDASVSLAQASVSNVEVLNINGDAAATVNGDTVELNDVAYTSAKIEGLAGADAGADTLAISGVNLATRLVLEDLSDVATTITFEDVTGTADSATIELSDVNGTTATADETDIIIGGVETQNVIVSAASDVAHLSLVDATTVNITADAALILEEAVSFDAATALNITANADVTLNGSADLATDAAVTVSGSGDVDLNSLENSEITVDATALTGGLTVTGAVATASITSGAGNDSVTAGAVTTNVDLGAGDDTFDTGGNDFGGATAVDIEGGAGTDTIVIDDGAELDADSAAHIKNFETLDVAGGTGIYDQDIYDFATVTVGTDLAAGVTVSNITDEALTITATTSHDVTYGLKDVSGAADSLTVTIEGAAVDTNSNDDTSDDTNDLTVAGITNVQAVETINLVSNTAATNEAGVTNTVTMLDTIATKVVVTGNHVLTITEFEDSTAVNATIETIDASASAGLIMQDGVSTANVSLIGSDSADTLVVTTVDALAAGDSTGSTINAGKGGDIIDLTGGLTITGATAADTLIIEAGDSMIGYTDTNDSATYTQAADAETFDIITGFATGDDTIDLGAFNLTGTKASAIAGPSLTEAQAVELVDGTTTEIADFFIDTGVQRGVAVVNGTFGDIGASDTGDVLVFIDSDGDGSLNVANDDMIVLSGATSVSLSDFGF
jgi:hypothetical protein